MTLAIHDIDARLARIKQRVSTAATLAGRQPDDVRLIAVTKTVPPAHIEAAMTAGHHRFGENTLQGAMKKQALLDDPSNEWHFIGHLQSNKARAVPGHFSWLHTLDSLKLARRLSDNARLANTTLNILLQVNVANDPHKHGLAPDAVFDFTDALLTAGLTGIRLCGLMTIGHRTADPAQTCATFARLRELGEACAERFGASRFQELSMGMSNDFELAIAEGATMVRVGSAIFGQRSASNGQALE